MQKISAVEDMQELALLLSIIILAAGISRANYPPVRVTLVKDAGTWKIDRVKNAPL